MGQRKEKEYRLAVERLREIPAMKYDLDHIGRQVDGIALELERMRRVEDAKARREKSSRDVEMKYRERTRQAHTLGRIAVVVSAAALCASLIGAVCHDAPEVKAAPLAAESVTVDYVPEALEIIEAASHRSDLVPLTYEEQDALWDACVEFCVPYHIALGIIETETNFRNISGDGGDSAGYMQVQAKWHGDRMEALGVTDLTDPAQNFRVALSYLHDLMGQTDIIDESLMAYNMGYSGASKLWAQGIRESEYSRKVAESANHWQEVLNGNL